MTLKVFDDNLQTGGPLLRTDLPKNATLIDRSLEEYNAIALRVRSLGKSDRLQFGVIANDGLAYGTDFTVSDEWKTLILPVSALKPTATLLTRAYPIFMPVTMGPFEEQSPLIFTRSQGFNLYYHHSNAHLKTVGVVLKWVKLHW